MCTQWPIDLHKVVRQRKAFGTALHIHLLAPVLWTTNYDHHRLLPVNSIKHSTIFFLAKSIDIHWSILAVVVESVWSIWWSSCSGAPITNCHGGPGKHSPLATDSPLVIDSHSDSNQTVSVNVACLVCNQRCPLHPTVITRLQWSEHYFSFSERDFIWQSCLHLWKKWNELK